MSTINKNQFIDILGWYGDVRYDYSGRGMYGDTCIGVVLEDGGDIFEIVADCAEQGMRIPHPHKDSMGLGTIYYWPRLKFEEE